MKLRFYFSIQTPIIRRFFTVYISAIWFSLYTRPQICSAAKADNESVARDVAYAVTKNFDKDRECKDVIVEKTSNT